MAVIDLQHMGERAVRKAHAAALKTVVFQHDAVKDRIGLDDAFSFGLRLPRHAAALADDLDGACRHAL